MRGESLSARDAVERDTPAASATSASVGAVCADRFIASPVQLSRRAINKGSCGYRYSARSAAVADAGLQRWRRGCLPGPCRGVVQPLHQPPARDRSRGCRERASSFCPRYDGGVAGIYPRPRNNSIPFPKEGPFGVPPFCFGACCSESVGKNAFDREVSGGASTGI